MSFDNQNIVSLPLVDKISERNKANVDYLYYSDNEVQPDVVDEKLMSA